MKKTMVWLLSIAALLFFVACGGGGSTTSTGTLSLNLTDAPFLGEHVKGVYIKITGVTFHRDGNWSEEIVFDDNESINLLDLQNGKSKALLKDIVMPAGHYTQIRFKLDAPVKKGKHKSNPGCYILFDDNSTVPLFVPSGGQSGYKAIGEFNITANAPVVVTADFDVRKSVVKAGNSGKYLLKPVIRLVINERSGEINGSVNCTDYNASTDSLVVYAYENDTFDLNETELLDENSTRFPHAVSSAEVNMSTCSYTLPYLAEGTYDLVVAQYHDGNYTRYFGPIENVGVDKNETKTLGIDTSNL